MGKQLSYLIFDLDGTLIDSCQVCVEILGEMLAERGSAHCIDPVAARQWMSHGGQTMVSALLGPACGDPAVELADFRKRYALRFTSPTTLFPGVVASLTQLADAGHTLAICSNKPQNLCEKVLADTGLAPLFDAVVGSRPELRNKPHPDLLDETLRLLDASPADCVFIGDSELDHQVAEGAGMLFKFLTYGYAHEAYVAHPGTSHDCFIEMTGTLLGRPASRRGKVRRA